MYCAPTGFAIMAQLLIDYKFSPLCRDGQIRRIFIYDRALMGHAKKHCVF
mgnify:CR=1 FL=1